MEIISKKTNADRLEALARDPVLFARETGFDPRPSQIRLLRSPLEQLISISSKARQVGATTTIAIWIAWSMLVKPDGWTAFVVAPNEDQGKIVLDKVYECYEATSLIKDNLKGAKKNDTLFRLSRRRNKTELLLIGDSGGKSRVGHTLKGGNGILLYEEYNEIPKVREVTSHLNPMTAWNEGGIIYNGTKAGFSGPYYDKYQFIKNQIEAGNPRYRIFNFPLREFIKRPGRAGIGVDWLKERKAEEPEHVWRREYLGLFAEAANSFFPEKDVRLAWQTFDDENITWDKSRPLVCGIDFGLRDRTAVIFAQDNIVDDRLEIVGVFTFRLPEHCKDADQPVNNYDGVVKAVCALRDRGYDPVVMYADKANKGGVYSDILKNVHGFNVEERAWQTNAAKTQALRSLANLIKSGRFLFPRNETLLFELNRYSPIEDPETGKYKFKDHNDDCISAMALMSEYLARDELPIYSAVSLGEPQLETTNGDMEPMALSFVA